MNGQLIHQTSVETVNNSNENALNIILQTRSNLRNKALEDGKEHVPERLQHRAISAVS